MTIGYFKFLVGCTSSVISPSLVPRYLICCFHFLTQSWVVHENDKSAKSCSSLMLFCYFFLFFHSDRVFHNVPVVIWPTEVPPVCPNCGNNRHTQSSTDENTARIQLEPCGYHCSKFWIRYTREYNDSFIGTREEEFVIAAGFNCICIDIVKDSRFTILLFRGWGQFMITNFRFNRIHYHDP